MQTNRSGLSVVSLLSSAVKLRKRMISTIVSRLVILLFGTLYPAYASYKAVRTKNVKEYVKWMMYWIVFALFTCAETFTDVFLSFWFPFYYEIKIIIVIWLLSPATKGSSILYRKFVHPMLCKREQEIDEYISRAKEQGYHTMLHLGSKGVTYATTVIMQTAIKGGGGIVNHLRRSYSLSDLSSDPDLKADVNRNNKSLPEDNLDAGDPSRELRLRAARKAGGSHVDLYFPEMDVDVRSHSHHSRETSTALNQIRSSEDISSGYSSADGVHGDGSTLLRTASVGAPRRGRGGRGARSRRATTEDNYQGFSADDLIEFGTQQFPGYSLPLGPLFPVLLSEETTNPSLTKTLTPELMNILKIVLNREGLVISNILENEEHSGSFLTDNTSSEQEYEMSVARKKGTETCIDRNTRDSASQCADNECVEEGEFHVNTGLTLKNVNDDTVINYVLDVDTLDKMDYEKDITKDEVNGIIASDYNFEETNDIFPDSVDPRVAGMPSENEHSLEDDSELFIDAEGEDLFVVEESQIHKTVEFHHSGDKLIQENTVIKSDELESKKITISAEDQLLHVEDVESIASSADDQSNYGDTENLDNNATKSRKGKYHKLRAPVPPTHKAVVESCNDEDEKKTGSENAVKKTSHSLKNDSSSNIDQSLKNKTEQLRRDFFSSDTRIPFSAEGTIIGSNFVSDKALVSTNTSECFREHDDFTKSDSIIELNIVTSDMKTENKGKLRSNIFSSVKKILHKGEETNEKIPDSVFVPLNCEAETSRRCEEDTPHDKVIIRQMSSSPSQKKRLVKF